MRLTVSVASLVTLALLTACGGGSVVEPQPQAPIAVGPSATESPAESPSFATRALKIPRATAMQTPSPVVATPTSSPSPTPTLAPTAVPATSTPEPEPTESQPDPSPAPTLDVAQLTARGERLVEAETTAWDATPSADKRILPLRSRVCSALPVSSWEDRQ